MEDEELQQGPSEKEIAAQKRAMRREKKNAEADRTTQALDNAANIAQFTPIGGYAKAYKVARSIDNKVTGGRLSRALSKTANKMPGTKSIGKIGSSGAANMANKALAAKDKLSGKGGSSGSSGSSTPKTPPVKSTTSTSTINGNQASGKTNNQGKKNLEKKQKDKKKQTGASTSSSEKKDNTNHESSSMETLIGEMTPMKIIVICVIGFMFFVIYLFIVLYNAVSNQHDFHLLQSFGEISSQNSKSGTSPYGISNVNTKEDDNSKTDDFEKYNQDYTTDPDGTYSDNRDDSKKSNLLAWAKKIFPDDIYLNYFNIGNVFRTDGKKCYGDECSSQAEVQFFQKVADISYRYKKLYHIELDWPLIMATVFIRSTDKEYTFQSNLNSYKVSELKDLNNTMSLDWEIVYDDLPDYEYLSPDDARYDLQILAKNMVKKKTIQTCKSADGKITDKLELEDIEDALIEKSKKEQEKKKATDPVDPEEEVYYLVCKKGSTYDVNSTYTLDKDKYKEFLNEYLEKRNLIKSSGNQSGSGSGNGGEGYPSGPGAASSQGNANYGWPLPEGYTKVNSDYGPRNLDGSSFHYGIDFYAPEGTPVYAMADGTVTVAKTGCTVGDMSCGGGCGNNVVIDHGNGEQSVYMHASRVVVTAGQHVSRGDLIMYSGNTGHSYGAHLHLSMKDSKQPCTNKYCYVNPWPYIGSK